MQINSADICCRELLMSPSKEKIHAGLAFLFIRNNAKISLSSATTARLCSNTRFRNFSFNQWIYQHYIHSELICCSPFLLNECRSIFPFDLLPVMDSVDVPKARSVIAWSVFVVAVKSTPAWRQDWYIYTRLVRRRDEEGRDKEKEERGGRKQRRGSCGFWCVWRTG